MKKLSFIILALLGILFPVNAQNRFNIYQENVVIKQIRTSDVDSITVSETSPHIVSFWHKGSVSHSFDTEEIDSITTSHDDDPLSYMGIVGFNDALYIKNIDVLAKSTAGFFRSFVSSLPRKDGTLLYYAVDNAMDKLNSKEISTPLSSVNLITFTDGLDQGSVMMNPRYSSSASYLNAMSELIRKSEFNGLPINAYAVGLRGNDVSDMTTFRNNLARLASSADKSFEVGSVSDLRTKFQDIANQIISVSTRQTISLKIPGIDSGTRVRFVFDGQSAESSGLYIEGTFNLSDRTLRNVTYHGMKSRSGSLVQGTQDGIFVTFTFMGLQREEVGQTIPTNIRHYYKLPSSSVWQQNSEFTPDNNTQRTVSHSGTIVMLVLDCSGSLGSDFDKVKQYANEFIDMIANNAQQCEVKAPENAKAELNGKDFTIVVSWDVVKNAESYQVYRSSSSGGTYSLVADKVVSTIWTDQTPLSGNNYYRIKAIGHGLTSGNSNTTNVVEYKLDAPENAKAEINDDNFNIIVSWDAVKYAEGYQVYRCSSTNGTYSLVADNVTSTNWTDQTPLAGNNYYRIKAMGHGLTSGNSNTTNAVDYKLDAPANAKVVWNDNDDVVVSWETVKHAELYQVYRSKESGRNFTLIADSVVSNLWTDITPLSGNNYYRIKAIGHGLTSVESNTTDVLNYALDAPTNAKAELDDANFNIVVSWDKVKHAEYCQVYRCSSKYGTYSLVADNVTSTRWTDNTPLAGNNYYRIKAIGHGLTSSESNTTNIVEYKLDAPANAKVVWNDNDDVVVSWDAVKHAELYQVYRSKSGRNFTLIADSVVLDSWTDKTPLSGNNYYRIKAIGHGLTSGESNTTDVLNYALDAPTNAKVVWNDNDDVVVSWDAVKHAELYQVYRSKESGRNFTLIADSVVLDSWTDKTPLSGNNYYRIKAIGHGLTSGESNTTNVLNYALDVPINVTAIWNDNDDVVVSWDAVKHAEGYQVSRNGTVVAESITSTSWIDKSPIAGINNYQIRAIGHGLVSDFSNIVMLWGKSGTFNGYGYVDLGLPSGTLWATCNIGATSPEDYGDYFAWGETEGYNSGKTTFNLSTYKWCNGSFTTMTKYCTDSSYGYNGFTDNKTELDPEDDAAYVNWGSGWRMPSEAQYRELINSSYTTIERTTVNGVTGRLITSKINGNSIFLPAAGYRHDSSLGDAGSYGNYWSRTLSSDRPDYASWYLNLDRSYENMSNNDRYTGQSIRPVKNVE